MGKNSSKIKGSGFEREIVNDARDLNLKAERAYASNGKSLGQHEEVDVMIEGYRAQCKRRKQLGDIYKPNENVDIQIFREDRGNTFVMMPYNLFLSFLVLKNAIKEFNDTRPSKPASN